MGDMDCLMWGHRELSHWGHEVSYWEQSGLTWNMNCIIGDRMILLETLFVLLGTGTG